MTLRSFDSTIEIKGCVGLRSPIDV